MLSFSIVSLEIQWLKEGIVHYTINSDCLLYVSDMTRYTSSLDLKNTAIIFFFIDRDFFQTSNFILRFGQKIIIVRYSVHLPKLGYYFLVISQTTWPPDKPKFCLMQIFLNLVVSSCQVFSFDNLPVFSAYSRLIFLFLEFPILSKCIGKMWTVWL